MINAEIFSAARAPAETGAGGKGYLAQSGAFLIGMLILIGFVLFFFALSSTSLWDNDESTYAEIAKEMAQRGHWLTLMFNHHAWFCHPPLYMWLTAFLFKAFGWSEITSRLFPCLFAILGMLVVFEFASMLWDRKTGFLAALILGTSLQYLVQGRMATMDSMLNAFILIAFYAAWRALEEKKGGWWNLFFLSCAFATLAKGIFGLTYPLFIFGLFFLATKQGKRWKEVPWGRGLLLYALIASPWFIYETVRYGEDFVHQVFYFYTYMRVVSPILQQTGPWYYYVPVLLFGFLPWSGFIPNLILEGWARRRDQKILFLVIWIAATFLFFTGVSTKLPNYIFFLYPPLAMLLASCWGELSARQKGTGIFLTLMILFFLAGGLEILALQKLLPREIGGYLHHLYPILGILAAGCAASLLAGFLLKKEGLVLPLLAVSMVFFWISLNLSFSAIVEAYKPMKPLGEKLHAYRTRLPAPVIAYHVPGTASLIFYTDTSIQNLSDPESFFRIWRSQKLYCFMEQKNLEGFQKRMLPYWTVAHQRTLWLVSNFDPAAGVAEK